jgi:hypothetical protein
LSQLFIFSPIFPPSILFYISSHFRYSIELQPSESLIQSLPWIKSSAFTLSQTFTNIDILSPSKQFTHSISISDSSPFLASLSYTESIPGKSDKVGQRAPTTNTAAIVGSSIAALIILVGLLLVLLFIRNRKSIDESIEEIPEPTDSLTADSTELSGEGIFISEYGFSENDRDESSDAGSARLASEDEDGLLVSEYEQNEGDGYGNGNEGGQSLEAEEFGPDPDGASISHSGSDDNNSLEESESNNDLP